MFGSQTILTKMATLVTVGDVCGPILTIFEYDTEIPTAWSTWLEVSSELIPPDPLDYLSLVMKQGKIIGWLDFSDLVADSKNVASVETCMTSIDVGSLVTAETPLLEAMKMFDADSPYCFLVMKGNSITGAFSYQDLLSIPFKSCLFAMLLSVEQAILNIAQINASLAVSKLRDRGKRVEGQIRKQLPAGQSVKPSVILERSSFSEVLSALKSCAKTNRQLPTLNAIYTKQNRFFPLKYGVTGSKVHTKVKLRTDQAIELRNSLAHPNQPWRLSLLLPKEDLKAFISWLTEVEAQLAEYLTNGNKLED